MGVSRAGPNAGGSASTLLVLRPLLHRTALYLAGAAHASHALPTLPYVCRSDGCVKVFFFKLGEHILLKFNFFLVQFSNLFTISNLCSSEASEVFFIIVSTNLKLSYLVKKFFGCFPIVYFSVSSNLNRKLKFVLPCTLILYINIHIQKKNIKKSNQILKYSLYVSRKNIFSM